jgi:hypothetical protein
MKYARRQKGRPTAEAVVERKLRGAARGRTKPEPVKSDWHDTGTFGAFRQPKWNDDDYQGEYGLPYFQTHERRMASEARKAMRNWKRTLPKGVTV